MAKMRVSRHNKRVGANGAFNPRHNDRNFDIPNSEHIDGERTAQNLYWDCYQGLYTDAERTERKMTFSDVELTFYTEHFSKYLDNQNERHRQSRHYKRIKTMEEIVSNRNYCPEETVYQIGKKENFAPAEVLYPVCTEFMDWFKERFGSNIVILDWALHCDETSDHMQVRTAYLGKNKYGEVCPSQERALEELGIPLPYPDEEKSKFNNIVLVNDGEHGTRNTDGFAYEII